MVEDEVADCVGTLDGVGVGCVGFEVGGIVSGNEIESRFVSPELFVLYQLGFVRNGCRQTIYS